MAGEELSLKHGRVALSAGGSEDLKEVRSHVPISRASGENSNGLDWSWFGRFWK